MYPSAHIFPSVPFPVYLLVETFFVALQVPCQIQLEVGFGFPNPISA